MISFLTGFTGWTGLDSFQDVIPFRGNDEAGGGSFFGGCVWFFACSPQASLHIESGGKPPQSTWALGSSRHFFVFFVPLW
jgi:hypothetical protein